MLSKPIIIVSGEPNSIFFEIFFKTLNKNNFKKSIILIGSISLLKLQMKKLNFKRKINQINISNLKNYKLNNQSINIIDVPYNPIKAFEKISIKSKNYIENSFKIAFKIINDPSVLKIAFFGGSTGYNGAPPIINRVGKILKDNEINNFVYNFSSTSSNHTQHKHRLLKFLDYNFHLCFFFYLLACHLPTLHI